MAQAEDKPVEVMVLGTYHFGNPGLDVVNAKVDDVTTPQRQRELDALADAVLAFHPTRVMVESEQQGPDFGVAAYAAFSPADLATKRNEIVQIGYRIARKAGLATVQGIDEQPGPGEPDYFPYEALQAYAKAAGEEAALGATYGEVRAALADFEARQPNESVPRLLMAYNDPASAFAANAGYYALLRFGNGDAQPGAVLNAMWYMRNAKIFAKLINASRPGDRVLVVYGAGHGYWLRHFAETTPGYRSVDIRPYLVKAASAIGR
ncbi:DUF5694 domain-containing protein [Novosphingobium sp. KCTC 2891]|uniref:DUF5694 domain-containing protein n=1 Tax=Novosphingobium sp. KCTC 2891 TaxID=2989730 RepID=UPI0022218C9D|nr:DUF5694 domain-containing protein [Novosphingobium sp. KCTC 2891]MCW1384211.1 DUF5694 domain-containing protein [Novosphingobium sp. KCTC 2891]